MRAWTFSSVTSGCRPLNTGASADVYAWQSPMGRAMVRRSVACGEDNAIHRDAPPFEHAAGAPATRVMQAGPHDGVGIDVGHHEIFLKRPTSGHDAAGLIHDEAIAIK